MKKLVVLLIAVISAAATATAQEAIAMLKHGTTTKTFTGVDALKSAHEAADNGDLITLSSGTFNGVDITKTVTIRGAGMEYDATYNTQPTIISGAFKISVPEGTSGNVQIEGIYHEQSIVFNNVKQQQNTTFIKCRLGTVLCSYYTDEGETIWSAVRNVVFLHCKIVSAVQCNPNSSMTFINCYVYDPYTQDEVTSEMIFRNCVVFLHGSSRIYSSRFVNCILVGYSNPYYNTYTTVQKCLLGAGTLAENLTASSNHFWTYEKYATVFKTYKGDYSSSETFELTDGAKTTYVDENGKEIGIHGGTFPYNSRVAGPHIKSMEVAPRSTADGMLNVKMTIENTGY